jgi:uncharacterized repeat protein (TIGR03803 family)
MKTHRKIRVGSVLALYGLGAISCFAQTFNTLHNFNRTDGAYGSDLVQSVDGNLYGSTLSGGGTGGFGTLFKSVLMARIR